MRGIVIAGTHSGCGKTTVTLGILAALRKKGLTVQSFKVGPDFIDAGLHRLITGRPSRNLDLWICGEDYVKDCFYRHSLDVDISIIEGVMGLYDGEFSTARLADVLRLPVILVVDAYGMAESAGAVVKGFRDWESGNSKVKGVIFNRVASERHFSRLKHSISDVDVIGYLPRDMNFEIPHRHLGLKIAEEEPIARENIERLADAVLKYVDIDFLIKQDGRIVNNCFSVNHLTKVRIAIAYDRAFCFYYEDNLDLLKEAGAEIIRFSPLNDEAIPDVDAIYIGGGYPELYTERLSKNKSILMAIYNWADSGRPIYAECGGLMYLSRGIHDPDGNFFPMAGVLAFETIMRRERFHLGYREVELKEDCILGGKGERLRGHEFHYSEIVRQKGQGEVDDSKKIYFVKDGQGNPVDVPCYRFKNTFASYIHIHFGSNPAISGNFINFIERLRWKI
jgi:cobyrinic acid a,c-diamide synthase